MLERYELLKNYSGPIDLKYLDYESLEKLVQEVRDYIIEVTAKNGGHVAPGLGVVELTIALLRVFDPPKDVVVWDIGHQAYPWKILTDRKDQFPTLRQYKGISGFLRREESIYDAFGAGHSSTSISAALGFRKAMDLLNQDGYVVAVIGDGAMTAVAHKLKRKWIGIEMGEHFYTVVLPRMKKVLAYDKSGISKEKDVKEKYNENNAGGFFKYYELEQYEDTLRKVKYEDSDLFDNPYQDPYNQYVFMKDLKMLSALEIEDYENNKVKVDLSKLYQNIDVPETLSNLLGKWIKKITPDYVEFEDGERIDLKNLDYNYKLIKPLIWW